MTVVPIPKVPRTPQMLLHAYPTVLLSGDRGRRLTLRLRVRVRRRRTLVVVGLRRRRRYVEARRRRRRGCVRVLRRPLRLDATIVAVVLDRRGRERSVSTWVLKVRGGDKIPVKPHSGFARVFPDPDPYVVQLDDHGANPLGGG